MAWTLCSKEDVTDMVSVGANRLPDFWSDAVEELIREHMHSPQLGASTPILDELLDGTGSATIIPSVVPIASVQSLYVGGLSVSPDEYVVSSGGLSRIEGIWPAGQKNIRISYTPSANVSSVVKLTAAMMIVAIFNFKGKEGADNSMIWGDADAKKGNTNLFTEIGLHHQLTRIMKQMLKRSRIRIR